jgi:hypothetical protein
MAGGDTADEEGVPVVVAENDVYRPRKPLGELGESEGRAEVAQKEESLRREPRI